MAGRKDCQGPRRDRRRFLVHAVLASVQGAMVRLAADRRSTTWRSVYSRIALARNGRKHSSQGLLDRAPLLPAVKRGAKVAATA